MTQQEHTTSANDEIDLAELFRNLWKKRLVVVLITLLGGLVGGGLYLKQWVSTSATTTASIEVRFNFPSIQNGTYPNGQIFSLNDLVAPPILNLVYDHHQIGQLNIDRSQFISSIQISPFAVNRAFIDAKFKTPLNNNKLTPTEIDELNSNYTEALSAASLRFAKISFSVPAKKAISADKLTAILHAIPATWARESIENYGVLDIATAKPGQLDRTLINNREYIVAAQYLESYLTHINQSADALKKDDIGKLQNDPVSGNNINKIIEELSNLKTFHVDILLRTFSISPVAKNINEAKFYLQNQVNSLKETLSQLERQAAIVSDTYAQYSSRKNKQPFGDISGNNNYGHTAQYGDEFLTKLISIGDELSDAKFKQELLNRALKLRLEAEQATTKINRLETNLARMESGSEEGSIAVERVETQIAYISDKLENLGMMVGRIADLRSQRALGQSGSLYDLNNQPTIHSNFREQYNTFIKFSSTGLLAGLFLGCLSALALAVIRAPRKA